MIKEGINLQKVQLLQRGNKILEEAHSFLPSSDLGPAPPHSADNMAFLTISPTLYSFPGLITYKDTNPFMSSLLVFNRV
jgi:hypothetical protein